MPKTVPQNAIGLIALIRPGVFWNAGFLERDYIQWAERSLGVTDRFTQAEIEQAAVNIIVINALAAIDEDIRSLPLEHPARQEMLRNVKTGMSLLAYLRDTRFFVLVMVDDQHCYFEALPATTIKEAQSLILDRPDVQDIERTAVVSWEPTVVH